MKVINAKWKTSNLEPWITSVYKDVVVVRTKIFFFFPIMQIIIGVSKVAWAALKRTVLQVEQIQTDLSQLFLDAKKPERRQKVDIQEVTSALNSLPAKWTKENMF